MKLCIDLFVLCMWYCWTGWPLYVPPAVIFFLPSSSISFCSNKGMYVVAVLFRGERITKEEIQNNSNLGFIVSSKYVLLVLTRSNVGFSIDVCREFTNVCFFLFFSTEIFLPLLELLKWTVRLPQWEKKIRGFPFFEFNGLLPLYIRSDT